jgi:hypothetical protein
MHSQVPPIFLPSLGGIVFLRQKEAFLACHALVGLGYSGWDGSTEMIGIVHYFRRKWTLAWALGMGAFFATGQSAPKYSNEFLSIGVGGRALGMGNTQVAAADDIMASYWNPAGLLSIREKYQIGLMHANYFAGIAQYDYLAFATPVDSLSHLAFSLIRFGVDDIPDTRYLYDANGAINYDNISFFSAADYAFLISYSRKLNVLGGLQFGGNLKIIHRVAGDFAYAWGFGLDAGARWTRGRWTVGAMFRDVTGTFNAWTHDPDLVSSVYNQTGNIIPENSLEITVPRLILGGAYRQRFGKDQYGVLGTVDLAMTFDGNRNTLVHTDAFSIDPSIGLELDYDWLAFLRIGVNGFQRTTSLTGEEALTADPSFGIGVLLKKVRLDYALSTVGEDDGRVYSHIFSLTVGLDKF